MESLESSTPVNPYASPSSLPSDEGSSPGDVPRRTTWPAVLGVIMIVFGSFGILGGLYGVVASLFLVEFIGELTAAFGGGPDPVIDLLNDWKWWNAGLSLIGGALAGLLLAAGIGLNKRRSWALKRTREWAVFKMIFVAAQAGGGYIMQLQQYEILSKQQAQPPFDIAVFGTVFGIFSIVITVVWGWALPVFLLIWLGRDKIEAETARWTGGNT